MRSVLLILTAISLAACQPKEESITDTSSLDQIADSVEGAITGASGAIDDASGDSMVSQRSLFLKLLVPEAHAACTRTLTNNGGGNCSRNVNCDFGSYLWSGTISLNFANGATCSLTGAGDSFTRTPEFGRTGPRGTIQTTSQNRQAWDGNTIGGGMTISQVDGMGNLSLDIDGIHKILTRTGGRTVFDMSVSTTSPLQINQLSRNGRNISSGVLSVHHNRARFTAEHTFQSVSYSSSCCYPTSGSISTDLTGTLNGNATVTFNGCGKISVSFKGNSKSYTLANCE
jgi:hypothetical protein